MSDLFDTRAVTVLRNAQQLRQELLDNVIGEHLPDSGDLKTATFILTALRDMEKVELDIARVRASQQQADAQTANAAVMAQLMRNLGAAPVHSVYDGSFDLPDELETELIEGEADIDYQAITYDQLNATSRDELEFDPDDDDED